MTLSSELTVSTCRCYDRISTAFEVGKYFSWLDKRGSHFFEPFYSVIDDFGNLVKVEQ